MTISRKITIAFGMLFLACVGEAVIAVIGFSNVRSGISLMTTDSVAGMDASSAMAQEIYRLRANCMRHILTTSQADMTERERNNTEIMAKIHEDMAALSPTIHNDADRATLAKVSSLLDDYMREMQQVLSPSRAGKKIEAAAVYTKITKQTIADLNVELPLLLKNKTADQSLVEAAVAANARQSLWYLIGVALGLTTAGTLVAIFTNRSIASDLRGALSVLRGNAEGISLAATQIQAASASVAEGSARQAATIEETSAASTEVNSMAQRNTSNSRATADMVSSSQERFQRTNVSLDEMIVAMDGITESSERISKIIKVIDEIAFQTNILALNAAVEAARAGEAGMGFAVVANEVRSLAQRCAQAAQDTSSLIDDSIDRSHSGKVKVDRVAEEIRFITAESAKMKVLVEEINEGSVEQARGMDEIARSITEIERVTQSTAAGSEQSASAARDLTVQAKSMQQAVDRLSRMVGDVDGTRNPARSPHAVPLLRKGVVVSRKEKLKGHIPASRPKVVAFTPRLTVATAMHEFPMDDDFKEF